MEQVVYAIHGKTRPNNKANTKPKYQHTNSSSMKEANTLHDHPTQFKYAQNVLDLCKYFNSDRLCTLLRLW